MDIILDLITQNELSSDIVEFVMHHKCVSQATVYKWRQKRLENPHWLPSRKNYGDHRRAMTDRLEESMMSYIEENYLDQGYAICDEDVKEIAKKLWEQAPDTEKRTTTFKASNKWLRRIKTRFKYVRRKAHLKRRTEYVTPEEKESFISTVMEARDSLGKHRVLNADQTNYKLLNFGGITWAKAGADSVNVKVNCDPKRSFTAMATISSDGEKYPLYLIAKGKTTRCHSQFNLPVKYDSFYTIDHSETGWFKMENTLNYLRWIRSEFDERCRESDNINRRAEEGQKIALVLDVYAAHRRQEVKDLAATLNIQLIFVPPSCTDELQPLDIGIFGPLKQMVRKMCREINLYNPDTVWNSRLAAKVLIRCWEAVCEDTVIEAWKIFSEPDQDEENFEGYIIPFTESDDDEEDYPDDDNNIPTEDPNFTVISFAEPKRLFGVLDEEETLPADTSISGKDDEGVEECGEEEDNEDIDFNEEEEEENEDPEEEEFEEPLPELECNILKTCRIHRRDIEYYKVFQAPIIAPAYNACFSTTSLHMLWHLNWESYIHNENIIDFFDTMEQSRVICSSAELFYKMGWHIGEQQDVFTFFYDLVQADLSDFSLNQIAEDMSDLIFIDYSDEDGARTGVQRWLEEHENAAKHLPPHLLVVNEGAKAAKLVDSISIIDKNSDIEGNYLLASVAEKQPKHFIANIVRSMKCDRLIPDAIMRIDDICPECVSNLPRQWRFAIYTLEEYLE